MKIKLMTATTVALALLGVMFLGALLAADKPVNDDVLYDLVRRRLADDTVVKGGALEVDVKEGVVTLRGTVEYPKQKEKASSVAKKVRGVKQVINELKVAHPK